jgi:hypothetical protein
MYQIFPFQGPRKFPQIDIFGFKIYHLATLLRLTQILVARKSKLWPFIKIPEEL